MPQQERPNGIGQRLFLRPQLISQSACVARKPAGDELVSALDGAAGAEDMETYERAFRDMFASLDAFDAQLSERRFLLGGAKPSRADWWLYCVLIRFDAVYHGHFKCNLKRIIDYPNLANYLRALYQMPGVAETVQIEECKAHYYGSHRGVNPTGIVAAGPDLGLDLAHDRGRFG